MNLKSIHLYRTGIGNDGPFKGSVKVDNANGSIDLTLNHDEVRQVLGIAKDSLLRISTEAAKRMAEAINDACAPSSVPSVKSVVEKSEVPQ